MASISIPDKGFVMAATSTQWACPAGVAVVFCVDVTAAQKIGPLLFIYARSNVAEHVLI
jgi:hypothetical protein